MFLCLRDTGESNPGRKGVACLACAYDIAVNDYVGTFPLFACRPPAAAGGLPRCIKIPGGLKTPLIHTIEKT